MATYILRRILISIPILFLVVTVVFFAFQLIPGDPARMYAGDDASLAEVEQIRADLGLESSRCLSNTSLIWGGWLRAIWAHQFSPGARSSTRFRADSGTR